MQGKKSILIIFLIIVYQSFFGQKLNLQKFSIKDGLIQSTVKQIEQDDYGNLWLATNSGLSKFNGRSFDNYTTSHGLPSNEVNSMLFISEKLFVGTRKGICFFNGYEIENPKAFDLITGNVKKILEKSGVVHVLTNKGYYLINQKNNSFTVDSIPIPNIASQNPSDAAFDEDGNLWISTSKKGVFFIEFTISTKIPKFVLIQNSVSSTSYNKKLVRIANFNSGNLLKGDAIMNIEFDKKFNLLISDWNNGFAQIQFDKINQTGFIANYINIDPSLTGGIPSSRIMNIYFDNEGNLYLATDGFGVIKIPIDKDINEVDFNTRNIFYLSQAQGFFGNNPLCFKEDKQQNLWVGTLHDGLVLLNNSASLNYNKNSGLEEDKIVSLQLAKQDSSIWCGTYGGGAFKFKNNQFKRCFWAQGISESIIKTIAEDSKGNVWLGTVGGGISIISKENTLKDLNVVKTIKEQNNLKSNYIAYLYSDNKNSIWVGYYTSNSIDKITFDDNLNYTVTNYPITNLVAFTANCITEDDDNNIWIAANEGVWKVNPKNANVNNEFAMFRNIQTLAKDWNGNMWLGSSDVGGIILKNKLKIRYFKDGNNNQVEKVTTKDGISSNCINSILVEKNKIWFVSNNGLNELKIDSYLNQITEIKSHHKGTSFASYDNKPNASLIDDDGVIWIGSVEGLTQHQTTNDIEIKNKPENIDVYLNSILIENKNINWTNPSIFNDGEYSSVSFDGFFNWYKTPKDLRLDYSHNSLKFIVNTNHIAQQKQILFSYKLIGYDKDWSVISANEISYRNLPSGDYSLVVRASLSSDFGKSKEFTYHFSVVPPFWKTKTFYAVSIICVLFLLYFYITRREKILKREKLKLELIVKSRTSEIEKKKAEIELQNNLIQGINNDLTDSIKYAKRIQQTILPNKNVLKNYFCEYDILYKPRNIVSGDYYWMKELDGLVFVAVVDCTGHGVPGAFMSLITSNILNESIDLSISQYSPAKMLDYLRSEINKRLNQGDGDQINDGLDISLICFDKENSTIEYVNANRPLYIISNDELITLNSENVSIGGFAEMDSVIPTKTISIKKGDSIFMFTDGITDQFGGEKNKKYNPNRLRQFLLMNNHLPMNSLIHKLDIEIAEWQGSFEQTDDILLLGLKI
jgi:ligand-binding sensor domain-containing protein/serine phosphatase RsbU (regulator of sigma subunit)